MGGAFVAVADDASAVYWNPAGLVLGGSYFSMVLDNNLSEVEPDDPRTGGRQSASLIAVSSLPVGVSYYRLSSSTLRQSAALGTARLERLTTHHAGVTVVQQLGEHVAIGSTLKWVHGYAASGIVPAGDRDDLLDGAGDLPEHSTNKFDMDVGVMALVGKFHAGVTRAQSDRAGFHDRERQPADAEAPDTRGFLLRGRRRTHRGGRHRCRACRGCARRDPGSCDRRRSQVVAARHRPQRFPLQYHRRRARRTCACLQHRRQRSPRFDPSSSTASSRSAQSRETVAGALPRAWCISRAVSEVRLEAWSATAGSLRVWHQPGHENSSKTAPRTAKPDEVSRYDPPRLKPITHPAGDPGPEYRSVRVRARVLAAGRVTETQFCVFAPGHCPFVSVQSLFCLLFLTKNVSYVHLFPPPAGSPSPTAVVGL